VGMYVAKVNMDQKMMSVLFKVSILEQDDLLCVPSVNFYY